MTLDDQPPKDGAVDKLMHSTSDSGEMTVAENIAALRKMSWKDIFIGSYDYKFLFRPRLNPWSKSHYFSLPQFFGRNDFVALLVCLIMGLQHAMAMIGGIVTPPRLVYSVSNDAPRDTNKEQYLVCAALIVSGITSIIQCCRFRVWNGRWQLGSGLLSVMGTSFTFLPIAQAAIRQMQSQGKTFDEAYGAVIGTFALTGLTEIFLSFLPPRVLKRAFPTTVCGITVFLIGMGLAGSGFKAWGGGAFCADNWRGILPPPRINNCFVQNTTTGAFTPASCFRQPIVPVCTQNGFVRLPFGSAEYVGVGLSVVVFMTFIELFGSPFLRNCNVLLSLFFGCLISGVVKVDGQSFWNTAIIDNAPAFTFIWTRTFPLSLYGPMVLPSLICYVITTVETIGDITATEEGGREVTLGPEHDRHVQGGLLGDGLNSILACLGTSMPNTTFSQNNGIIVLTRCASRMVGFACAGWLLLSGIIGKFGAFFVAIPDCVLGGMTTFLFANVAVTGIKVMNMSGMQRRDRYITLISIGLAMGVAIVPQWATGNLWPVTPDMSRTEQGIRDGIIIMLWTPYCLGGLVAMILHLILPQEASDEEMTVHELQQESSKHNRSITDTYSGKMAEVRVVADLETESGSLPNNTVAKDNSGGPLSNRA